MKGTWFLLSEWLAEASKNPNSLKLYQLKLPFQNIWNYIFNEPEESNALAKVKLILKLEKKFFFYFNTNRSWHLWHKQCNSKIGYLNIIFEVLIKWATAAESFIFCYWYETCLKFFAGNPVFFPWNSFILPLYCSRSLHDTFEVKVPSTSPMKHWSYKSLYSLQRHEILSVFISLEK